MTSTPPPGPRTIPVVLTLLLALAVVVGGFELFAHVLWPDFARWAMKGWFF